MQGVQFRIERLALNQGSKKLQNSRDNAVELGREVWNAEARRKEREGK